MNKIRVPVARLLTWPWLTSSLHTRGQYMAVDSIKRALPSALDMTRWQVCKAAGEQDRGWSGGSTEGEAQRAGVQDGCAERHRGWLCRQRGPEAETGLLHADSLWVNEILVTDLPPGNKVGYNSFTPKSVLLSIFFGHTESIVNLPRAETHWQDSTSTRVLQDFSNWLFSSRF